MSPTHRIKRLERTLGRDPLQPTVVRIDPDNPVEVDREALARHGLYVALVTPCPELEPASMASWEGSGVPRSHE